MSEPFDKGTFDKGTVDSSAISSTSEEGSRFQLSREMKILLGVLALGAAVGGWYVFSGAGAPAPEVNTAVTPPTQSTPATPATPTPGTPTVSTPSATPATPPGSPVVPGVTPSTGSGASGQAAPGTGVTAGSSPVTVPNVPFLNPAGSTEPVTPDPAAAQAGINPVDPLAAVPSLNPFKPLKVVDTNAPVTTATAIAQPQASTPVVNTASTPPQSVPSLSSGGAIPLPNVPLNGVSGNGGGVNLNGSTASSGSGAAPSSGLGNGGAIPLPNVPLGPTPSGNGPATGATTAPTASAPPTPTPPPAAGSITPGLNAPALGGLALGMPGTPAAAAPSAAGTASAPGTGNAAGSGAPAASSSSVPLDSGGQPGLISQYGSANAPAVAVASPLDVLVQSRALVFNAVVLGPINTAIFKTSQGFVVVPTGQTLPDSNVTLKQVTATSATLSLGTDSKILELDKR